MAGKFEVYQDVAGLWRFRLVSAGGKTLAVGEAFPSRAKALAGIERCRVAFRGAKVVDG